MRTARGDGYGDNWRRDCYSGLLLDLKGEDMDDEAFLEFCRQHGRRHDLVNRLLQLGRVDEAVGEIEKLSGYELLQMADLLVEYRQGDRAEELVRKQARGDQAGPALEWLLRRAKARKDWAGALELALQLFHKSPHGGSQWYDEVRTLASKVDRWEELRPSLLAALKKKKEFDALIRIHLKEGEIDAALKELKQKPKSLWHDFVELEVAKAAEKTHPCDAADLYEKEVTRLIEMRGRGSYQEACSYLKKVRALYQQMDRQADWDQYIARIRAKYPTLRALQEELNKAKL
jgi:hypothetical protein